MGFEVNRHLDVSLEDCLMAAGARFDMLSYKIAVTREKTDEIDINNLSPLKINHYFSLTEFRKETRS